MRGFNGDPRAVSGAMETINAAADAIAAAESRGGSRGTVQKRRWGGCLSIYWCFGAHRQNTRIRHAVLVPETTSPETDTLTSSNPNQTLSNPIALPFIVPPSSPASFFQSEPPSTVQSPTGLLMSASMYSPGPASIFAIGPYAYETQLVSPPVFSTFTTEPSTAPFTPPPESVHLTTPSSPEVPFAQLFDSNLGNGQRFSYHEFQSYQFQPGSPVGQLISPSSGTSSPFPQGDFAKACDPPKLLNLDNLSNHDWTSRRSSGDGLLLNCQISEAPHRVSFELTDEAMPRRDHPMNLNQFDGEDDQKNPSVTLNEFKFKNADGCDFPWKNEKVAPKEVSDTKNWAFFPMIQPGV